MLVVLRGGSAVTLSMSSGSPPSINDAGAVAFIEQEGSATRLLRTQDGIGFTVIADSAVHGLRPVGTPSINGRAEVLFAAEESGGRTTLYVGDGNTIEPVVARPGPIFDGPIPGNVNLTGPRSLNGSGQIAFAANGLGIYRADPVGGSGACSLPSTGPCDDQDPCTVDADAPAGCLHDPVGDEGDLAGQTAVCASDVVPAGAGRQLARGCGLILQAGATAKRRKARTLLGKSAKSFRRGAKVTRRDDALSAECAAALACTLDTARARAPALRAER